MKKLLIILTVALISLPVKALTLDDIRNNTDLIVGEGFGDTYDEADQNALANLMSRISVNVNNKFTSSINELTKNGEITSEKASQMVVNTYAQGQLNNTDVFVVETSPKFHLVRYIQRDEVAKAFDDRRKKIELLLHEAMRAEQTGRIALALRNYYHSLLLVKSLPSPGKETFVDRDGEEHNLMIWLPIQIEQVLGGLTMHVTECTDNEATLFFAYNGKPVVNLDFSFYNGIGWTPLNSAKNGVAKIEVRPGVDISKLRLKYEYEYAVEAQIDPDIKSVIEVFEPQAFRGAEFVINSGASSLKQLSSKAAVKEENEALATAKTATIAETTQRKSYNKVIQTVIEGIMKNDYQSLRPLFTDEGWSMLNKLLHFGKAKMLPKQDYGFYDLPDGHVVCRSLVMSFSFPNNHRTFTEDVTFTFNTERLIDAVSFGLGVEANADIFNKAIDMEGNKIWSDKSVLAIVTFLENYKTAFALKNLDYLQGVFDDNAVIITGKVIKKAPKLDDSGLLSGQNKHVIYNRYSKEQYMQKLERAFKSQEFINLRFSDNDVTKMGIGGELYSIQIHQDYYSSTYGDTGYLFLIVDVNNPDEPIIKVRTWQPERDPSINGRLPKSNPSYGLMDANILFE